MIINYNNDKFGRRIRTKISYTLHVESTISLSTKEMITAQRSAISIDN
jgi:hypothetical protein